jgi:hypothetical protein
MPNIIFSHIRGRNGYLIRLGRVSKARCKSGSNYDKSKVISTFSAILLGIWFSVLPAHAATITAASTSQGDVSRAIAAASAGDTVNIPAGQSIWNAAVKVSQPIVIVGAGQAETILINGTSGTSGFETPLFNVVLNVDRRLEISNLYFQDSGLDWNSNGINLYAGSLLPTQIVIHDCTFDSLSFAVMNGTGNSGACFGVVYNCRFLNCRITSRNSGYVNTAALRGFTAPPYGWGSANYMVYEDNIITFTNWTGGPQGANYIGDTEYPMNYMVRHCTFNINRGGTIQVDGYDLHGNDGGAEINSLGMVIHDNTFNYTGASVGAKLADIRGGVGSLVYNNTITGQTGNYITLRADPAGSIPPSDTYIWNNRGPDGAIPVYVSAGIYTASAPTGYVEVAYPHPLRAAGTATATANPTPASPTDLHIVPGS